MSPISFIGELRDADWRKPSVVVLVLANLVPVFGVLALGWEVFPLMFLFWFENLIVGAVNVLKMLAANPASPLGCAGKLFIIPFFCFHYGMFTFVHGIFVITLFGGGLRAAGNFPSKASIWRVVQENHLGWAILGLAISHAVSFATNYIGQGEYKRANVPTLMAQPYARLVVLHIAILGDGFLMLALRSPTAGLLVLVALKIALDLKAHLRERKKFGEPFRAE